MKVKIRLMVQHDVIAKSFPHGKMHPRGKTADGTLLFDVVMLDDQESQTVKDSLREAGIAVDTVEAVIGHFTMAIMPPEDWVTVGAIVGLEIQGPNS